MKNIILIALLLSGLKAGILETRLKACNDGNAKKCWEVADMYSFGMGVDKADAAKTIQYYRKSCDMGYQEGCISLGMRYILGQGIKQNYSKGIDLYKKACNLGHSDGCNNLGFMYEIGEGVKIDLATAKKFYSKACDLGSKMGCNDYTKLNKIAIK